jgi:hypothetical protein
MKIKNYLCSSLLALGLMGVRRVSMIRRGLHQHLMFPTHCSEQGNATRRGLVRANAMRALLVIAALWLLGLPSRPAHARSRIVMSLSRS